MAEEEWWVGGLVKCCWCQTEQIAFIPVSLIAKRKGWALDSPKLEELVSLTEQRLCVEILQGGELPHMNRKGESPRCRCLFGRWFDFTGFAIEWVLYEPPGSQ